MPVAEVMSENPDVQIAIYSVPFNMYADPYEWSVLLNSLQSKCPWDVNQGITCICYIILRILTSVRLVLVLGYNA